MLYKQPTVISYCTLGSDYSYSVLVLQVTSSSDYVLYAVPVKRYIILRLINLSFIISYTYLVEMMQTVVWKLFSNSAEVVT